MRNIHGKSVILGIGIGMIITAFVGMIYSAGTNKPLSKTEIMNMAKGYGMVESLPLIQKGQDKPKDDAAKPSTEACKDSMSQPSVKGAANETGSAKSTLQNDKPESKSPVRNKVVQGKITSRSTTEQKGTQNTSDNTTKPDRNPDRNIVIDIKSGYFAVDVARLLYQKRVISNQKSFLDQLGKIRGTHNIIYGKYSFKENDDFDFIVKSICKLN